MKFTFCQSEPKEANKILSKCSQSSKHRVVVADPELKMALSPQMIPIYGRCPYWCRSKTTFENLTKQSILDPALHPGGPIWSHGRVQAVDNIFLHFTLAFGVKTTSLSLMDLNRSLIVVSSKSSSFNISQPAVNVFC